jgi:RNA polymerase sigma-70 factor, ECF subfamily
VRPSEPFVDPERLIRRVYAYVAYRIGDGPDAEDITAEAMARALRYQHSYDQTKGDATGWVIAIARRLLLAPVRESTAQLNDEPQASDEVEDGVLRRLAVRAAVARLGERDRELVALRYGADLSAKEIAALLDMTTNAVDVALHRALGRLRTELADGSVLKTRPVVQPIPD